MLKIVLVITVSWFMTINCSEQTIRNRWVDIENVTFTFNCYNKSIGFYADVEYDCQIFHMCDQNGRRIPHMCANDTAFNQEYRVCDWENNFECAEAPNWYYLNDLTYITEPPKDYEEDLR